VSILGVHFRASMRAMDDGREDIFTKCINNDKRHCMLTSSLLQFQLNKSLSLETAAYNRGIVKRPTFWSGSRRGPCASALSTCGSTSSIK
jgi:hypothetical protein